MHSLILTLIFAFGPWGSAPCPSVEAAPAYTWVQVRGDATQIALMQGNKQLGNYHTDLREFHPLQPNGEFTPGNHPLPHPLPAEYAPAKLIEQTQNFGVDRSHIKNKERYIVNGMDVTSAEAFYALTEKNVPNDKDHLRLTIIGPEEMRKQVRKDLDTNPELREFRNRYLVQDYAPDNWAVKEGFFTAGKPTIYLQAPNGKVLHRQDDYIDGASGLATALRKADPSYSPVEDKDARKSNRIPVLSAYVPFAFLLAIAAFLFLIPNKPKK